MNSCLTSQKGSALVGIMLALVIIAALVYGGSFFWGKQGNPSKSLGPLGGTGIPATLDQYSGAKKDLAAIEKNLEERNDMVKEIFENDKDIKEAIEITSVKEGDALASPITIEGFAQSEENTLVVELRNSEHETMVKEAVNIKSETGERGPFKINLNFSFSSTEDGYVAVYDNSSENNKSLSIIEIPVKFQINKINTIEKFSN